MVSRRRPERQCKRRTIPAQSAVVSATCTLAISSLLLGSSAEIYKQNESLAALESLFLLESSSSSPISSSEAFSFLPSTRGPIMDATCNAEQLEEANDSQLHSILVELKNTAFFRSFAVDLDETCPLATWARKKKNQISATQIKPENGSPNAEEEEGTVECASEGLPDLDPDAGPACGVNTAMPWQQQSASSFSMPSKNPSLQTSSASADLEQTSSDENEDSSFDHDCQSDELDDDAPPLCAVSTGSDDSSGLFPSSSSLFSSALKSISEREGWQSEQEEKTFAWSESTDPVVSPHDEPCDEKQDDSLLDLPDTFWVDMCSNIKAGDSLKIVDLALNPEHNTGYNGTHIWHAIYEENCISLGGSLSSPMCYEERVLYRLLSGLHASTTLSIAKNFYPPSKRKGRANWEPNLQYFMDKFGSNPDHIRNIHFSYVVLLRALKKASTFLYSYEIRTGNIMEDEAATVLLRRLLDSAILRSCHDVFTAFDESLMFKDSVIFPSDSSQVVSLEENFKDVFHNISSILDCVQCQQCKLHGKMAMMGYGVALKILFLPREDLIPASISRNEVVALINTIAKMSESMKEIRELTTLYWAQRISELPQKSKSTKEVNKPIVAARPEIKLDTVDLVDAAVGAISSLGRGEHISAQREAELVRLAFARDPDLMILAKHYSNDLTKFLRFSPHVGVADVHPSADADALVVGSGLAGLAATLRILDRGGRVVIIEKEHRLGGNSNKASSGINACCPNNATIADVVESFKNDTIKSAGTSVQLPLIQTLVENSASAVQWLKDRVGVDLSLLAQLGGHSHKRTHRPSNGMAGAEIIYGMQKAVREYEKKSPGSVQILVDTRVTNLVWDKVAGRVTGVEIRSTKSSEDGEPSSRILSAPNIVLATGGFAADRSPGSYLSVHRPELLKMPATAGNFSTGDGITLATALGAGTIDMDKVQLHPTGWVDPLDPGNPSKILAAELMRGVGGMLFNSSGQRFCNELGTRAYVTDKMLGHDPLYSETKLWNVANNIPTFSLVLSSSAAEDGKKHVDLYRHKGLLRQLHGVEELSRWMDVDVKILRKTLEQYRDDADHGIDTWGKTSYRGVPNANLDDEIFYAGTVVPVLHYCMGGITIDTQGNVLDKKGRNIPGLHAAGEVTGGVHGNNRLGGNSLLECTVFGSIVGEKLPLMGQLTKIETETNFEETKPTTDRTRPITTEELSRHASPEDCWVAIRGQVYDLTDFAEEHPPGAESIHALAGRDGTEAFSAVHNREMLGDFEEDKVGILVATSS